MNYRINVMAIRATLVALCVMLWGVAPAAHAGLVPGDFNDDFWIDLADYAVLQREFSGSLCVDRNSPADIDSSGCVNLSDYLIIYQAMGLVCADPADCGIQGPNDCKWKPIADASSAGQCDTLPDPVDQHLCALGVLLDGNVADEQAAGAAVLVDTVPDELGVLPGPAGDEESPRRPGGVSDPNGFNIGQTLVWFVPDSDPTDGVDDSFLYLGWNISDAVDADGLAPRQYDSDDNESASELAPGCVTNCAVNDTLPENYKVFVQACTFEETFDQASGPLILAERDPNQIQTDRDADVLLLNVEVCTFPVDSVVDPPTLETSAFPTADGLTNLTNLCIDQEVDNCAAGNDVEMVIRRVETSGAFGPHAAAAPDSPQARDNRLALAQLLASMHAASNGDESDEEIANVAQRTPLPQLEVVKRVRCADSGQTEFTAGPIEALIGSTVEFELTIENVGNEDLAVTVEDVLGEIGAQAALAGCDIVCDSLEAELTSPRRGLADLPIDVTNANAAPVCDLGVDPQNCLNPDFFAPSCAVPGSFVGSVQNGSSALLGTLLGAVVARQNGACQVTDGDRLVLRFKGVVGLADGATPEAFCETHVNGDCRNTATVTGTRLGETDIIARDEADVVDTDAERQNGNTDDNGVIIDLLCRDITFLKAVGLAGDDGSFVSGTTELTLPSVPPGGSVDIEYLYVVENVGETDESVTISDSQLCNDIAAVQAAFPGAVTFVNCALCTDAPVGEVGPIVLPAGVGAHVESCIISFTDQAALRDFLLRDDGRDPCNQDDPGLSGSDCYRNCASATADAANLGDICRPPAERITRTSFTTVCNAPCEIAIRKEVRCLPDCDASGLGADEGWVAEPDVLDAAPGACLQYRIVVENAAGDPTGMCALKFTDLMSESANMASGPANVALIGRSCTNLDFASAFNWDGNDVTCRLDSPLKPGQSVTVMFEAQLAAAGVIDAAATPTNQITVMGASEADCPDAGEPSFSCMDEARIAVDVKACNLQVTKDVTCDDPRSSTAVFDPDMVDALPGSRVGFRVQIENAGEANLASVEIDDALSCDSWYVTNSVVADVNGVDVTDCVCPPGGCGEVAALNGVKDLTPCITGGIAPGEVLTITFEVKVPDGFAVIGTDEDCVNTVVVRGATDVCQSSDADPCPERTDAARVNVDVPDVTCAKSVCADLNNNGTCDDPEDIPAASDLFVPGEAVMYPLTLVWEITVSNSGETDFIDARACDATLAADLGAGIPGVNIVFCDLVADPESCASVGALGNGDPGDAPSFASVLCVVRFDSEEAWLTFAERDGKEPGSGRGNCYRNTATAEADVDAEVHCAREGRLTVESDGCPARVCIERPIIPTVSEWGMVILSLLLLIAAKLHFGYARRVST